ncbi:diacylglycerol/lipid kinase family protein [Rhodohalobacter sp. 614A]|uniref:diacylglycerol/lipid kinase family protein n=1 Tax=Rhodohalobacter sp. 614A TaxID=2908649 RepID=UPI001F462F75|nr:YegS/Rv2252/BmrU family lipid kinase [Rhodohalobacter sp. 614A]
MQNQNTRICFIINPAADRHRSAKNAEWLRQEASKLWKNHEIVIADKRDSLSGLARKKSKEFDVIVACGGDGTISQIVNGLAKTSGTLGVLPIGSGNDFVKSIGLKKSLTECLKVLHQNHTTKIDLIRYEGDIQGWCVNTIGIGIDGWANFYAHQTSWLKGRITYYYGALKAILKFHGSEMQIKSHNDEEKNNFLMITACNGKWEGGSFLVAPDADLQDGELDILTVKKVPQLLLLAYLLRFRWGPAKWMKGVEKSRTTNLEISSAVPLAVHRDGEHLGTDIRKLKLTVEKNSLNVIVPEDY